MRGRGKGGNGELFHGTDMVIGNQRRGTRSRKSFEVEGWAKMRDLVHLALACRV